MLQVPPAEPDDVAAAAADLVSRGHAYLAAGVDRIMLDAAGGPHPGGTGTRASERLAAAVARELPVVLAGGLAPANVAGALRAIPATGVDVASGVERPRAPGARPTKDPLRVALFVKRARAARDDRPNIPFGPTPIHAGLLDADGAGRWGMERDFGGRYVPETLMAALEQLETAYDALRQDPVFWAELRELLGTFAGRPTALYRADRLAAAVRAEAERLAGPRGPRIPALRLYLKREDLAHTGAHKINNALGQALLTRRLGKTRVIAETGAGQHGVATATACALLDLPCVVYMGAEDIERQGPNVLRMRALGAEVRSVTSGTATLKDAVNEAMRDWVTNVETTHYVLGSAMGPHPYPTIVRDLQRRIGDEAAAQLAAVEGRLPDLAVACVGGGSNAIGLLARFIGEPSVRLAVVEAAGDGIETGRHAAAILGGTPGILHGSRSLMLQDADGQVTEAHSASAGLDYPGIGPQLAALAEGGRIEVAAATDREAVAAMKTTTRTEGILPALETAHAVAALPKLLAGHRRGRWVVAGRGARPRRVLRARRQGPRGARAVRRCRAVGGRPMTTAAATTVETGTNATAGARRIAAAFARARADGRAALIPYVVAGYPDAETSFADRPRRGRRRRRPARGRAAVLGPAGRRRHAPARVGRRARGRRDARAIAAAHRADRRRPAGPAARPDGLRQPGHRRRRRRGRREAAGRRRCGRAHRRRPDARRGRAVRGRRSGGRAGRRLPRRPDDAARPARRGRRPERRVPVLRLAGRGHRRADVPAGVGRQARPRGQGRLAGPGRGRVRGQQAGPRPGDREGRAPTA